MVHIICCFQCPSAVVENGKVTCVALWISFFFFSISRGKFYTSTYYFLVASGNKSFFLKCPSGWFFFFFLWEQSQKNGWSTVFSGVVLSMWTNDSRMSLKMQRKRVLEMTARKKQQCHVHISFIFTRSRQGRLQRQTPDQVHQHP